VEPQASTISEAVPTSSFGTRAAGVFSSPGEVFAEVGGSPVQTSSWLLPYILSLLIAIVFTFALFNNQSLRQQVLDPQKQKLEKQVEQGKMTQDQYDKAVSMMESPPMFFAFGVIGSFVFVSLAFFLVPAVLMLAAKAALKASVPYKKMLEVFGLSSMVGVLGAVITLLMMHLFDSVHATPGLSLVVMNGFDQDNMGHKLLAAVNVFSLWQTWIVGKGISGVTGTSSGTGVGLAFGLWVVWVIVSSLLNLGMR
jgi:hypothetical protein